MSCIFRLKKYSSLAFIHTCCQITPGTRFFCGAFHFGVFHKTLTSLTIFIVCPRLVVNVLRDKAESSILLVLHLSLSLVYRTCTEYTILFIDNLSTKRGSCASVSFLSYFSSLPDSTPPAAI